MMNKLEEEKKFVQDLFKYVDKKWKWAAVDGNGKFYFHSEKPAIYTNNVWEITSTNAIFMCYQFNFPELAKNWKESLIERQVTFSVGDKILYRRHKHVSWVGTEIKHIIDGNIVLPEGYKLNDNYEIIPFDLEKMGKVTE